MSSSISPLDHQKAPSAASVTPLSMLSFFNQLNADFLGYLESGFREHGDFYRIDVLGKPTFMAHQPDHLHEILVTKSDEFQKNRDYTDPRQGLARFFGNGLLTSNGDFWKKQRRLVAPTLHSKRIGSYAAIMAEETAAMLEGWQDGAVIDVAHAMTHATLQIVSRALFSLEIGADGQRIGAIMSEIQEYVGSSNTIEALLPPWIPTPRRSREAASKRELNTIVYRIIDEWKRTGLDRGDLLSMLLLARDDDGQPMTDEQVRDEIVTMFLAGHETTANTLNWLWMLVAQHPEVEARLHEEVDRVVVDGRLTLEDIRRLPYTEQVVKEALRLYPPAFIYSREAIRDTTVGGYPVPAGSDIQLVVWTTHRDARWWDDPLAFRPERFARENEGNLRKYAYLPFGGGPRVCIGNSFALMEAQIMTALIAARFRLRLDTDQVVTPEPLLTLRPLGGLPMTLEARQPAPDATRITPLGVVST